MMRCLWNVLALHFDLMEHKYILRLTRLVLDKTETQSDVTKKDWLFISYFQTDKFLCLQKSDLFRNERNISWSYQVSTFNHVLINSKTWSILFLAQARSQITPFRRMQIIAPLSQQHFQGSKAILVYTRLCNLRHIQNVWIFNLISERITPDFMQQHVRTSFYSSRNGLIYKLTNNDIKTISL